MPDSAAEEPSNGFEPAIEAFVRGFTYTRSFTWPYLGERAGSVWVMRDAPRELSKTRCAEVVAYRTPVEDVDEVVRQKRLGAHRVCILVEEGGADGAVKQAWKALGYRMRGTEQLMTCDLANRLKLDGGPYPVRRVLNAQDAETVKEGAGGRQILPCDLRIDAPLRLYAAWDGDAAVGWVRSIDAGPGRTWVSNMFVRESYRRQGIGASLMAHMLDDDAALGRETSVLLATEVGSRLYPRLGYARLGRLLLFSSPR